MMRRATMTAAFLTALALPAAADDDGLASFDVLTPDTALALAEATLESCRAGGYQVAVAVLDRFGQTQVLLRDRFAGPHTIPTATAKAWTAVSFRGATQELDTRIAGGELEASIRDIPGALFVGGGVPVMAAGSIVGGVGVSGAPGPSLDEDCAEAGIEAISDVLDF
ncbi:MAG: heme-binding protein [Pseudomonadota bacterium]